MFIIYKRTHKSKDAQNDENVFHMNQDRSVLHQIITQQKNRFDNLKYVFINLLINHSFSLVQISVIFKFMNTHCQHLVC